MLRKVGFAFPQCPVPSGSEAFSPRGPGALVTRHAPGKPQLGAAAAAAAGEGEGEGGFCVGVEGAILDSVRVLGFAICKLFLVVGCWLLVCSCKRQPSAISHQEGLIWRIGGSWELGGGGFLSKLAPAKAKQVAICAHHQLNYIKTPPFPTTSYLPTAPHTYRPPFPHSLQSPMPVTRPSYSISPPLASLPDPPAPMSLPFPSPVVHTRITALHLQFLSFPLSSFLRRFPAEPDTTVSNSIPS
jgi:hypothetical protein